MSGMWSVDSAAVYKMPPHIDTQLGREREEVEGRRGREREEGWERWRGREREEVEGRRGR